MSLNASRGSCCAFSSVVRSELWIGASQGTLFCFDFNSVLNAVQFQFPTVNVPTLTSLRVITMSPPPSMFLPSYHLHAPIQSIGHISGMAGCFTGVNRDSLSSACDNPSVVEMVLLTQGGVAWVLEKSAIVESQMQPKVICLSDSTDVLPLYDICVCDITVHLDEPVRLSNGAAGAVGALGTIRTRRIACLLGASKASTSPSVLVGNRNSATTPALVQRFALKRTLNGWSAVVLSKSCGHAFSVSLPRPVAKNIMITRNNSGCNSNINNISNNCSISTEGSSSSGGTEENILLTACPDEKSGSLRVWVQPLGLPTPWNHSVQDPHSSNQDMKNVILGELVPLTVPLGSDPVISVALTAVHDVSDKSQSYHLLSLPKGKAVLRIVAITAQSTESYILRST